MAENYLVTGGGGFIGSHVVDELLARGHAVKVLDNFSTGRRPTSRIAGDVELVEGDVRSYERANTAVKGVDVVIHLAALPSVPRSVQDPLTTTEVNVTGTLNVLLAARDREVRRVVLASSSSVYGANDFLPKHEELIPHPISPYGVSKLAAEQYAMALQRRLRPRDGGAALLQRVRPAAGPELAVQRGRRAVPAAGRRGRAARRSAATAPRRATSPTCQRRRRDAARRRGAQASGSVLNIGCGASYSGLDLIAAIEKATGGRWIRVFGPARAAT